MCQIFYLAVVVVVMLNISFCSQEVIEHRTRLDGEIEFAGISHVEQTHTWFMAPGVSAIDSGPWTEQEDLRLADALAYVCVVF